MTILGVLMFVCRPTQFTYGTCALVLSVQHIVHMTMQMRLLLPTQLLSIQTAVRYLQDTTKH